jgi:hypothetical protein
MLFNRNEYIYILFIIFLFLFLFLFLYITDKYYVINYIENFSDNIIFLDNHELLNVLLKNNDQYYNTFFENDFNARNINNIDEYKDLIKKSITSLNEDEKNKIKICTKNADLYFSKIKLDWFDGIKNNKIKWIIGCIKGKLYENGLPHTRDNVIIIPTEKIDSYNIKNLTKTLIHEKIHIYQKYYKDDINIYLNKNNFVKVKRRDKYDNIRANPDLDNLIYKDNQNNIYKAIYKNNPSSVEDIIYLPINTQLYEHPYEKMAIEIEDNYYK